MVNFDKLDCFKDNMHSPTNRATMIIYMIVHFWAPASTVSTQLVFILDPVNHCLITTAAVAGLQVLHIYLDW